MEYADYNELDYIEYWAVREYMEKKSTAEIEKLIKSSHQHTDGFKLFLADLVAGRIKRAKGRAVNSERDYAIYNMFADMEALTDLNEIVV